MDLLQAVSSSTVNLTVSSDSSSAKSAIESFVESYNELYGFINEQFSYNPDEGEASPLLGDPTLLEIRRRIADTITGAIPGLSTSSYRNLSQIGIKSNYITGKLSIDNTTLDSALSKNSGDVSKLFIGTAVPTNQAITYESKTSKTQAGTYGISISTAPEQATLTGDNDLSSTGLGVDETLILKYSPNYTESDATFTAFSVALSAGSTINTIVTELNSAFATHNAGFTASNSSGKLKITSTDYGEDIWFQITTDNEGANQIWNDDDADPTLGIRSDAGVDIAGSINNHAAIGKGNVLTAVSGYPEEGLAISTTSNQTGLFGKIAVSRGITDLLPSIIDSYVNSNTGVLKSKESSMQDSVDDIGSRIERLEKKIEDKEKRLFGEFARLEVLLSKYNSLAQYFADTLTTLPKIGSRT
jgi:flagellar hook-associated protein 2